MSVSKRRSAIAQAIAFLIVMVWLLLAIGIAAVLIKGIIWLLLVP